MKMPINRLIQKICEYLGVSLLILATVSLIMWKWNIGASEKKSQNYVETIQSLIPEPQSAVPAERRDNSMSVLSVDGKDFVGIIEIPRYGSVLPVGAKWGKNTKYPCYFDGSVYDSTLKIGATTQKGQYDFYHELSDGDTVFFTDMEGNRYTYVVAELRYEKHADLLALNRRNSAFTLFIKNIYSFDYLIVYCDVQY